MSNPQFKLCISMDLTDFYFQNYFPFNYMPNQVHGIFYLYIYISNNIFSNKKKKLRAARGTEMKKYPGFFKLYKQKEVYIYI